MAGFSGIDGINSGLDTTSIVDALMELERQPAVLLEKQQVEKQAVISAYQALQAKFLGLSTNLANLTKASTFEQSSVSVSNEDYLSVTSEDRLGSGIYDLQVLALARNHQLASAGVSTSDASLFGTGSITIQVGDSSETTIAITSENNTLEGIKNAINDSSANVTASIINDGTDSNSYRLILTSDKTGAANSISFSTSLTGGTEGLNFSASTFDSPEIISRALNSSSNISLGMTAAFTGNENKTYTFTVSSAGAQIVGSDMITLDWTDGTNSGSILVTQADTEVELVGDGADGLTISLSAGEMNEGDSFQISTFAPTLQQASDAKIAFGSADGSGSPIVITSDKNTFSNVLGSLDVTVKKVTEPGQTVTIETDLDVAGIKSSIKAFIDSFNDVVDYVDEQNSYNAETDDAAPVLFGDYTVWSISNAMRNRVSSPVSELSSQYKQFASIGININTDGKLVIKDPSKLEEALRENLDDVIKLFTTTGDSTNNKISFESSTVDTRKNMSFSVDITKVATKGGFKGGNLTSLVTNPITIDATNKTLKFKVDGVVSNEITLSEGTYDTVEELISELQLKIDRDDKIGARGVQVEWVDNEDGTGYIELKSSSYGSTSKVETDMSIGNSAYTTLGLATGAFYAGQDVEGTINGEVAKGVGQYLTGDKENENTAGLKLKITMTEADLAEGIDGTVKIINGVAASNHEFVQSLTESKTGLFDRRIESYQKQIDQLTDRISDIDERLALRRESLFEKYYEMETVLGELNSVSSYLTTQLAAINNNWQLSGSKK